MKTGTSGSLEQEAVGGFLWLTGGSGARGVVKIVTLALLARLVTPTAFGMVGAGLAVAWLASLLAQTGVGQALVQRKEVRPAHRATAVTWSVFVGLAATAAVHGLAPPLEAFFDIEGLAPVLRLLSWSFPFMGLSMVAQSLLQRELRFRPIAVAEFVSYAAGYGMLGVVLAWLGLGVWALAWGHVAKAVLKCLAMLRYAPGARRPGFEARALRELLGFGTGHTAGSLGTYFALEGDNLVVAKTLGADALGLYGRAYQLMAVPAAALGEILDKILFPTMSRVQDDEVRLRGAYDRSMTLLALMVLPVSALTIVLAPEIVLTLLGPGWEGAVPPLRVLAIAMYFRIAYMVCMTVARSRGAVYRVAWRSAGYAAMVVLGAAVGQLWGLEGVAWGVLAAITANFLLMAHLANRVAGLPWSRFASLHRWPLGWTLGVLLVALGTSEVARIATLGAPVTLAGAVVVLAVGLAGVFRLLPGRALGPHGPWIVGVLRSRTPEALRPVLDRVVVGYPEAEEG